MALQNAGIPVSFDFVLPAGAYAESVEPVRDFDASKPGTAGVQARDKLTGRTALRRLVTGRRSAQSATVVRARQGWSR